MFTTTQHFQQKNIANGYLLKIRRKKSNFLRKQRTAKIEVILRWEPKMIFYSPDHPILYSSICVLWPISGVYDYVIIQLELSSTSSNISEPCGINEV